MSTIQESKSVWGVNFGKHEREMSSESDLDVSSKESDALVSATKNKLGRKCWHRTWARLQLKHVVDQRAFWHVFRLLLGSAGCILLARVSFCNDAFSAVFTFFLCVSAFGGSTWLSVKEVLIGK